MLLVYNKRIMYFQNIMTQNRSFCICSADEILDVTRGNDCFKSEVEQTILLIKHFHYKY